MKLINLLPKDRQKQLKYESVHRGMVTVTWVSVFSIVVMVLVQFGIKFVLEARLRSIEARISAIQQQMDKQDNAALKNEVKNANDTIADYKQLSESSLKWSKFLEVFVKIPPPSVRVDSLTVEPLKKTVTVRGFSPTRELVLKFSDNLKNESSFSNVVNPFENLVNAKDVRYQFIFTIKEDLLK